jgi:probable HAF family extracellular repeat protein
MKQETQSEIENKPQKQPNYMKEPIYMNTKHRLITFLSTIALTACVAVGVSSAGTKTYSLTDLGVLPGKKQNVSTAAAINDLGQVAGTSDGTAFRYTKESKIPMEDISQNPYGLSRGFGIDGSGQVVGDSTFGKGETFCHAAIFSTGSATDLGTINGEPFSRANGINAFGQVVGFSGPKFDSSESRAFVWTSATGMFDLGTLGGSYAQAWAINDTGFVTGHSQIANSEIGAVHAFICQPLSASIIPMRDLGTLAGDYSYGTFINAQNHVVGYSTIDKDNDRVHAFLHDGEKMLDLGSLGGAAFGNDRSFALGVNASDQVVGYSYRPIDRMQQVAFIYSRGLMVDLNDLIGTAAEDYLLYSATAINDKGQIVAIAHVNAAGDYHAVLLTPIVDVTPTIQVTVATYAGNQSLLTVQATCTGGKPGMTAPELRVYAGSTGELIGLLNTKGNGSYFGSFFLKSNPKKLTIMSNNGGRVDAIVEETSLMGRN